MAIHSHERTSRWQVRCYSSWYSAKKESRAHLLTDSRSITYSKEQIEQQYKQAWHFLTLNKLVLKHVQVFCSIKLMDKSMDKFVQASITQLYKTGPIVVVRLWIWKHDPYKFIFSLKPITFHNNPFISLTVTILIVQD